MKIKSIVTAIVMAGAFGAGAATVTKKGMLNELSNSDKSIQSTKFVNKISRKSELNYKTFEKNSIQLEYFKQNKHVGSDYYIIRLVDNPITTYSGGIKGLEPANLLLKKSTLNSPKFNAKSEQAKKYATYLDKQQNSFVQKAVSQYGISVTKLKSLKYAINGIITKLTYDDAVELAKMPEVAFIERNVITPLNTDTGPEFIGSGDVWDGSATGSALQGEGVVVGIIDTGINTDHPSFAATGDDGFTVTNPLGANVYVGDCESEPALCNSKLIGVRSYQVLLDEISAGSAVPAPTNGEDYNGHGSHTAGTSAGNVLLDVPFTINDPASGATGDGIATATVFPRMSGVAPHANVISYQSCLPGDTGDSLAGCFSAAGIGAIDDAIQDGVDVINYSVGGTTQFSPWTSATEIGFLSAQAAGIFVATSAGNSGPNPSTNTKASPWYTAVGALTHGRSISGALTFDGSIYQQQVSSGPSLSAAGITAPVIYAGTVDAANFEGCLAFATDSFINSIALISRGGCGFVDKVNNASDAGATAVIVHNHAEGGDSLVSMSVDGSTVPSVFVGNTDGLSFVADLAATPGLTATLDNQTFTTVSGASDVMASFSSRGPNEFGGTITPQIAAPGVSVYAAYADEKPYGDVNTPDPSDYGLLSGTSMASPHIAGAAALVMQAHPTWNADQVRSALMMTSTTSVLKEDGETPADPFDIGAGRVQVNLAVNAGLVMSEIEANYLAADPANGGDVRTLNIPSMADYGCFQTCTWTRTFTAVSAGTYTLTTNDPLLSAVPTSFEAVEGSPYSVTFSYDASAMNTGEEVFAEVGITSAASPDLHLPVYVKAENGAVPELVEIKAGRNNGSWAVSGVSTGQTENLSFSIDGLYDANAVGFNETVDFSNTQDPSLGDPFSNDFGDVFSRPFTVPINSVSLTVTISEATSQDNDLYILVDTTGDGIYDTIAGRQADAETNESVTIESPVAGEYLAVVQNYLSSTPGATDTGVLSISVVPQTDPVEGLTVDAPTSGNGAVDVSLLWDIEMLPGDSYFADITVMAGETEVGTFRTTLDRESDDFSSSSAQSIVARGEQIDYTVSVKPTTYNQDVDYLTSIDMPENMTLVPGSVVVSGGSVTLKDPNAESVNFEESFSMGPDSDNSSYTDDLADGVHVFEFDVPAAIVSMNLTISESTSPDNDLFIEYAADGVNFVNQLGFAGATNATNEVLSVNSPSEGKWRAVVQNYASENTVDDTGILSIELVPARGEGFFWNLNAPAFKPLYVVASSATDDACAVAGFGGYLALSNFGFPTIDFEGDTVAGTLFAGSSFPFFGETKSNGITITDDGFVYFSGTSGTSPWANTSLPNAIEPNDMIALLWKDTEIVNDGVRGVRVLQDVDFGVSYIDFSGIQGFGQDSERLAYSLFAWDRLDNPDGFEFIVAYSDDQTGSLGAATAGVENSDGTLGFDASSMIEPGVQLCYNYNAPPQAYEVTFSVVPTSLFRGENAAPLVTVESSMNGTEDISFRAAPVDLVNVGPTANAGEDMTYDRENTTEIALNAVETVDLDVDRLSYEWEQVSGNSVTIRGGNSRQAFLDVNKMKNGTYVFQLKVADAEFSSTDQVSITIVGEEKFSAAGSLGIIFLMLLGVVGFRRKK